MRPEELDRIQQEAARRATSLEAALAKIQTTRLPTLAFTQVAQQAEGTRRAQQALQPAIDSAKNLSSLQAALTQATRTPALPSVSPPTPAALTAPTAWREVGVHIRTRLFRVLVGFDATLVVRIDGAWERIARGGPHSASQAAHSTAEFVDWCLRTLAPDSAVLEWHREASRPDRELHESLPTRGLRMRYIVRDRDPDGPQAREFIRHGLSVLKLLQDAKHGNELSRGEMAALIMSVESLFAFLLAER